MKGKSQNKSTGNLGERIAADFLVKKGYKIVSSNFKTRYEEIDLIAVKDDTLIFVEVKTRLDQSHGAPEEAVTPRKLDNISRAAEYFTSLHPELPSTLQIDVVAIEMDQNQRPKKIEHLKNVTG